MRISAMSGWFAREPTQAAMTDSSFRAGTIAVTEPAVAAVTGVPVAGGLCALFAIFSWMRNDCFPAWRDWVSIAFDENPSENRRLGSPGGRGLGGVPFCDAPLSSRRGLGCRHHETRRVNGKPGTAGT